MVDCNFMFLNQIINFNHEKGIFSNCGIVNVYQ